jgi:hypothetical protein
LTFRTIVNCIDFGMRARSLLTRTILERQHRDNFCPLFASLDDDSEILYSVYDLNYVIRLLSATARQRGGHADRRHNSDFSSESGSNKSNTMTANSQSSSKYIVVSSSRSSKQKRVANYLRHIYEWTSTFRFTSRYINTIVVALVALYYVFLYWTYQVAIWSSDWVRALPDRVNTRDFEINPGVLLCSLSHTVCFHELCDIGVFKLNEKIIEFTASLRASMLCMLILPAFIAFSICLVQIFLTIRESKIHLTEMWKGKCEFVDSAHKLNKVLVANSSFHFGG